MVKASTLFVKMLNAHRRHTLQKFASSIVQSTIMKQTLKPKLYVLSFKSPMMMQWSFCKLSYNKKSCQKSGASGGADAKAELLARA